MKVRKTKEERREGPHPGCMRPSDCTPVTPCTRPIKKRARRSSGASTSPLKKMAVEVIDIDSD